MLALTIDNTASALLSVDLEVQPIPFFDVSVRALQLDGYVSLLLSE